MKTNMWTEEEIFELSKDPDSVLNKLVERFSERGDVIFAAKLGFGIPPIDIVTVNNYRATTGYIVRFPVVDGEINSLPYYRGFGESIFLADQMLDGSFLIFPDLEVTENNPFSGSPNPRYRLGKVAIESGVGFFDKDFNVKIFREAKGSLATQYNRLKIEMLDSILNYGDIKVGKGKEALYKDWANWVKSEVASLGDKKFMDKATAKVLCKKILEDKNYHSININLEEEKIEANPRPIPVFNVTGSGLYLGDEEKFNFQLSRISGRVLRGEF
jgi:hypothetical protein